MTFTKERLQKLIRAIDSESYDEEEIVGWVNSDEILELARIALAARTAEPVGEVVLGEYDDSGCHPDARVVCIAADGQADWENFKDGTRLYAAPPAPVVPDELLSAMEEVLRISDRDHDAWHKAKAGIVSCRAAMLQGAEPVSQGVEFPLDYLQGQKDGLEWAARLAEANHPQTADWLYDDPLELAKAIRKGPNMPAAAGNSPMTLDGWVACSERLPENKPGSYEYLVFEELNHGVHHDYWNVPDKGDDCQFTPFWNHYDRYVTHWMPLPTPPQQSDES